MTLRHQFGRWEAYGVLWDVTGDISVTVASVGLGRHFLARGMMKSLESDLYDHAAAVKAAHEIHAELTAAKGKLKMEAAA